MSMAPGSDTTASAGAPVLLDWSDDDEPASEDEGASRERAGHNLTVEGHGLIHKIKHGPLVAAEAVLAAADVEALGSAVRDQRRCCAHLPETIVVGRIEPAQFDPELFEDDPVTIEVDDEGVYASLSLLVTRTGVEADEYRAWLQSAAAAHGCVVASVRLVNEYGSDFEEMASMWPEGFEEEKEEYLALERTRPRYARVRVAPAGPMTVGPLLAAGRDVLSLLTAIRGGPIDVFSAANLIRAQLPHLLFGLPENEWLEVKSQPYNLQAPDREATKAKIELAQDVARFANGEGPALLVVGLRAVKEDGREVIRGLTPAKLPALSVEQHRDVIDSHVYPTVDGLTVEVVETGDGKGLLMIGVPAQAAEQKPFLVHGAVVGGRAEGTFISIVRRRGEGSIVTTASQIHAQLTAGRALLQEMSAERLRRETERLRKKSYDASRAVLTVIAQADEACHAPPGSGDYFTFDRCLALAAAIERHSSGIVDDEVRERVESCRHALYSYGANWSNFPGNKGVAPLLLMHLVRTTRRTLQAYIAEKELPRWIDLPDSPFGAFAWLVQRSLNPS